MEVFWAAFGGGAASGVVALLVAVVVEVWRDRRDRPKLKVEGVLLLVPRGTFEPGEGTYFSINAGNVGRRPVHITGYGFQLEDDVWFHTIPPGFAPQTLPYDLEPGHSFTGWSVLDEMGKALAEKGRTALDIKRVWVRDAVGRHYFGKVAGQAALAKEVSKRTEENRQQQ